MLSWGAAPRQPESAVSAHGRALLDRGGMASPCPGAIRWPINGAGDGILGDRGDGFEYWVKDASFTAHKSSGEMRDTGRGAAAAKRVVD